MEKKQAARNKHLHFRNKISKNNPQLSIFVDDTAERNTNEHRKVIVEFQNHL